MPHLFMVWSISSIFWLLFWWVMLGIVLPLALIFIAYEKVKRWFLKLIGRGWK